MKKTLALVLGAAILFSVSCDKKEVSLKQTSEKPAVTEDSSKSVNEKTVKVSTSNSVKANNGDAQKTKVQPKTDQSVQEQQKPAAVKEEKPAVQTPAEPAVQQPAQAAQPAVQEPVQPAEQPVVQEPAAEKPVKNTEENTTEPVVKEEIGTIKNMYESNGKKYVDIDFVEFYTGEDAVAEAEKDGKAQYKENGEAFVYDGYYIRNTDSTLVTYEVSSNAEYYLCGFDIGSNSGDLLSVSESDFNQFINNKGSEASGRATLCWIDTRDGIVNSLQKQYTP